MVSRVVALLVLVGAAAAVFGPGLTAAPQFDQTQYFLERQEWPTFAEAVQRLDYSLARRYWKGDEAEFRPLLFLLMAAEYAIFGADMRGWQAVNLGLHVAVAFMLYLLLSASHTREVALLLATLFVVLMSSFALVQDPYGGGYLAACVLLLAALRIAWASLRQTRSARVADWVPFVICMTMAAFFFEVMTWLSLVLAACVLRELRRRGVAGTRWVAAVLLVPCLAYGAAYLPRISAAPRLMFVADAPAFHPLSWENLATLVPRFLLLVGRWAGSTAMPTLRASAARTLDDLGGGVLRIAALAANGVVLVAGLVTLLRHRRGTLNADGRWRLTAIASLMIGYAAIIRFGRGATEDNHLYIFGLLAVLAVGTLVDVFALSRRARLTIGGLLLATALMNATLSEGLAARKGREGAEYVRYLSALDRFVRAHRQEAGFSFLVDPIPAVEQDREIWVLEGYPDRPRNVTQERTWETFYGARRGASDAKYSLTWTGADLIPHR